MAKSNLKPTYFLPLFMFLVIVNLVGGHFEYNKLRDLSKPLILLSLLIYFGINGRGLKKTTYILMLSALFFSWMGDILLKYEAESSSFFIYGLIAFLTAHLLYCITFTKRWNNNASTSFWAVLILLITYGMILFFQLKDELGQLMIPVIIYVSAILLMAITGYRRKDMVSTESFKLVFMGALLFIASDSILAINKFLNPVPYSHILVMGTYAAAQFLITKGVLTQDSYK